jgi:transcriptional regulator with GAF, ATPase, and Fis domain
LLSILRTQIELHRALQQAERLSAERLLNAQGRPEFRRHSILDDPDPRSHKPGLLPSDANVLPTGEHGSGKEVVVHLIHARSNVPFRQQAKLLRVIESGEMERVGSSRSRKIDVRVISATNAGLKAACEEGEFREDLLLSS